MRHEATRALVVLVTSACNLRCRYCFVGDKPPRVLAWPALRDSLGWILQSPQGEARVVFSGGEPLLALPTIERAVAYLDRRRASGPKIQYEILTNGMVLGEKQLAFLAEHDFRIELSFDGVREAQDLRGRGTFTRLDRLVAWLRREHAAVFQRRLGIAMTLCRDTVRCLGDSVAYFLSAGVPKISVSPAITADPRWTSCDNDELDDQFARMYQDSVDHYGRTGKVPLTLFRKTSRDASRRRVPDAPCRIGAGHALVIDATGRVFPCPLFATGYHTPGSPLLDTAAKVVDLGPVSAPGLAERLEALAPKVRAMRLFTARRHKYSTWGRCRNCEYLDRCPVCPVSVGLLEGNTDPDRVPDFQCAYWRTALKYRERFPCQAALREVNA